MEHFLNAPIRCYYNLERPRRSRVRGTRRFPLLIALHGFQGNKDSMMRLAKRMSTGRMVVISLQGPYQFYFRLGGDSDRYNVGFGWGTNWKLEESVELHHRLLRRLIRLAVREDGADPRRVFLLGFSQACSFNYRFMTAYPGLVRGVVAVCGGVPHEWREHPSRRRVPTDVLHIAATNDEWYSREKNLEFRELLGARVRSLDFRFYKSTHRFPRKAIPHIRRWIEKVAGSSDAG